MAVNDNELPEGVTIFLLSAVIVCATVWAILGYYLLKPTIATVACFTAAVFSYNVLDDSLKDDIDNRDWIVFGSAAGLGLIGALIALKTVRLGIFAIGAGFGVSLALGVYTVGLHFAWKQQPQATLYLALGLFGLCAGLICLWYDRPVIVVGTSFSGSFLGAWCVSGLLDDGAWPSTAQIAAGTNPRTPDIYYYAAGIVGATAVCASIQFCVTSRGLDHRRRGEYVVLP